jgi:hypothetical protein
MKKLYASRGYIHFGAIPTQQIDEKQHTATLTLEIIEGERTRASVVHPKHFSAAENSPARLRQFPPHPGRRPGNFGVQEEANHA